jgi:hypothetical protein
MECSICFGEIKDHKLFKFGCCSINLCLDCVENTKIKKCPQCKKSYKWIISHFDDDDTDSDDDNEFNESFQNIALLNFQIHIKNERINLLNILISASNNYTRKLETKIQELQNESMIKGEYMKQMTNTIVKLIVEKEEEEENERDLESVITRYHLNLI